MPVAFILIPLFGIVAGAAVLITLMNLIARNISERNQAERGLPSEDVTRRLERIEGIVETTALEVERIAEANRFVAKLLADKSPSQLR